MALRKETRTIETKIPTANGEVLRNVETDVVVFDLTCDCGEKGGEIVFKADHPRAADPDKLEAELKAEYSHKCPTHAV